MSPSCGEVERVLGQFDELVRDAIAGDRTAFARLLGGEAPTAYRAALAILRSPELAQEAVQEAAIRAWQQLPTLRAPAAWPWWFRRLAVRVALDEHRRARYSREVRLTSTDIGGGDPDPMGGADDRLSLLSAFARLSADDRVLLALRFQSDLTVPDVARTLGIRLGTTKARLHRAIGRLRAELRDDV
jgi:RNA polymerase sigma-70 factor (ECF subfamily)